MPTVFLLNWADFIWTLIEKKVRSTEFSEFTIYIFRSAHRKLSATTESITRSV